MPRDDIDVLVRLRGARKFQSEANKTGGAVSGIGRGGRQAATGLKQVEKQGGRSHKALRLVGRGAAYALGAGGFGGGLYALFNVTKKSVTEFRESQKVTRQTSAVLASTGKQAGLTSNQVANLATSISLKTGIDDEAIQTGSNLLLTFTKIRNEAGRGNKIFDRTTMAVVDMATAMNHGATPSVSDLHGASIQLGKAMNDPIKGITALQRVGVSFTEKERDKIRAMVESGNVLGAQKRILKEVTTEFGGSARKQRTSGKLLRVSLGNIAEQIGAKINPLLATGAMRLNRFITQMRIGKGPGGEFARTATSIFESVKPVAIWFGKAAVTAGRFAGKHPGLTKVATALLLGGYAARAFRVTRIITGLNTIAKSKAGQKLLDVMGTAASRLWTRMRPGVTTAADNVIHTTGSRIETSSRAGGRLGGAFTRAGRLAGGVFAAGALLTMAPTIERSMDDFLKRLGRRAGGKHGEDAMRRFLNLGKKSPIGPLRQLDQASDLGKLLGFAGGGTLGIGHMGIVGERGPELAHATPGGTVISPLGGGVTPLDLKAALPPFIAKVYLGHRQIAEAVADDTGHRKARR